jgi:hypothetical protein
MTVVLMHTLRSSRNMPSIVPKPGTTRRYGFIMIEKRECNLQAAMHKMRRSRGSLLGVLMLASLLELSGITRAGHFQLPSSLNTPRPIRMATERRATSTPLARTPSAFLHSAASAPRSALTGTPLPSDTTDWTSHQTPCPPLPFPTVTASGGQTGLPQGQLPGSGVNQIAVLPSLTAAQAAQVLACPTLPSSSGSPPDDSWIAFIRRVYDYSGSLYLVHEELGKRMGRRVPPDHGERVI